MKNNNNNTPVKRLETARLQHHTQNTHYTPHSTFRAVREYARGRNRSWAARNQVRVVGAEVKFKNWPFNSLVQASPEVLVNTSITTNNVKPLRQNTSTKIKSLVITPREIVKSKIKSEFAISNKSKQQRVKRSMLSVIMSVSIYTRRWSRENRIKGTTKHTMA